jgi:hypothetical protein
MKIDEGSTFTCWKEIAAHLEKGVRTVQRWERQFGLPVQRPNARSKGIVRASRDELDHWMSTQWSRRATTKTKPAQVLLPDRTVAKNVVAPEELRASNRELLNQFKESLRELNTHCQELRETLGQRGQDEKPEPTAA